MRYKCPNCEKKIPDTNYPNHQEAFYKCFHCGKVYRMPPYKVKDAIQIFEKSGDEGEGCRPCRR